jgi:hypothetical protein
VVFLIDDSYQSQSHADEQCVQGESKPIILTDAAFQGRLMNRIPTVVTALFATLIFTVASQAQAPAEPPNCFSATAGAVATRPTVSNSTATAQCGVVEVDYGFSDSILRSGDKTGVFTGAVRYGITPKLEFRWASDNLHMYQGGGQTVTGGGDNWLSGRYRLTEQKQTWASLGVMYLVKVPNASATKGFGSGYFDHLVMGMASKDLGKWHADFNFIQTFAGREHSGYDQNTTLALAVWHPITKKWNAVNELYGSTPLNTATPWFASDFVGATYSVTPVFVLDGGVDVGLMPTAPRARLQFGMTYSVGNINSLFVRH